MAAQTLSQSTGSKAFNFIGLSDKLGAIGDDVNGVAAILETIFEAARNGDGPDYIAYRTLSNALRQATEALWGEIEALPTGKSEEARS